MNDDKTSTLNASRRVTIHSIDAILRSEKAETNSDETGPNQVDESKKMKSTDMDTLLGKALSIYLNLTQNNNKMNLSILIFQIISFNFPSFY